MARYLSMESLRSISQISKTTSYKNQVAVKDGSHPFHLIFHSHFLLPYCAASLSRVVLSYLSRITLWIISRVSELIG